NCTGADDVALVDELNVRMMGGLMSGTITNPTSCVGNSGMKGALHNLLRCGLAGNLGQTNTNVLIAQAEARRRKALYLIHLIAISPEYAHQR
ncbi:MAG TPA: hypothetical protein VFL14_03955, partial [Xanthomonadales bacterium]|nr:hypothetical protein [Xanthomonadales bacterium]